MSSKLPSISPITVPADRPSPIMFDHKKSKSNITKLVPININISNEKEIPRKVINPSLDRSKIARPKTASKHGRRPSSSKGGRKTRKAKKSKKTRKNRKSKSKRKTRKN